MMERLVGKVAIVTGAGTKGEGWGNGGATAAMFARQGAKVVVVDLHASAARQTVDVIKNEGGQAIAVTADVSDAEAVAAMVSATLDAYERIDILQNNVGIAAPGDPHNVTDESWKRTFEVNLDSILYTCRHVLPQMVEQRSGSIINISSISSVRNLGPAYIAYPASKAAVNQFSRIVAAHYGSYGIRCNTILPGFIDTPMVKNMLAQLDATSGDSEAAGRFYAHRKAQIPLGRMGTPWDIANAALFLATDESSYITGAEIVVDGGVINQTV